MPGDVVPQERGRALAVGPVAVPPGGTKVAWPLWVQALVWGGFTAVGAGAGALLLQGAGWLAGVPFGVLAAPARFVDGLEGGWVAPAVVGAGALLGFALAWIAVAEALVVTVDGAGVALTRGTTRRVVPRGEVTAVFHDSGRLVLLGRRGEELAREKHDLDRGPLAAAFRAHGYPWRDDGDPFAGQFRRWVEGVDGLPPGADPLLAARQRALEKGDATDAADLRRDLADLGVVVREDGKRQFWRLLPDR